MARPGSGPGLGVCIVDSLVNRAWESGSLNVSPQRSDCMSGLGTTQLWTRGHGQQPQPLYPMSSDPRQLLGETGCVLLSFACRTHGAQKSQGGENLS